MGCDPLRLVIGRVAIAGEDAHPDHWASTGATTG